MAQTVTKTVVFIHGAFCGGWCFGDFVPGFEARGFVCHVPDLRFHVSGPTREPDWRLAQTSIADYTRDMAELVASLSEPPIIIGHSMGGVIGQQLAAKGLARSLVLLASGAPWGMLPSTDDELALATGLMKASPFWDKALNPSFEVARQDSLASLDPQAQRRVFDQFGPESGRALFERFLLDVRRAPHDRGRRGQGHLPGSRRLRLRRQGHLRDDRPEDRATLPRRHVPGSRRPRPFPHHGGRLKAARRALCRLDRESLTAAPRWKPLGPRRYDAREAGGSSAQVEEAWACASRRST